MIKVIFQIILVVVVLIFLCIFSVKEYRNTKSHFEKSLYIILLFSIVSLLLVYYLDRYNIPSRFGYTQNITSDWVSILLNYSATIISTLLSSIILIFVTFRQMDETYSDNMRLNNEVQRMQNLPFLQYDFTHEILDDKLFSDDKAWIFSNQDDSDSIIFTMKIENIGLNAVRKVHLEVESELFEGKKIFELCNQSNIQKNQMKKKMFIITNVSKGTYKIEITVHYQDLLKNWYKQKVHLLVSVTKKCNPKTHSCNQIDSFIVDEEVKQENQTII